MQLANSAFNGSAGGSRAAPKGKAKAAGKSQARAKKDPVTVSLLWRRKTLKDYNKVQTGLQIAKSLGERTIDVARIWGYVRVQFCLYYGYGYYIHGT